MHKIFLLTIFFINVYLFLKTKTFLFKAFIIYNSCSIDAFIEAGKETQMSLSLCRQLKKLLKTVTPLLRKHKYQNKMLWKEWL